MGSIRERNKRLCIDFRLKGIRCREQTSLEPTQGNIARAQRLLKKIEREIQLGTFSYREYFPQSKRADLFEPTDIVVQQPNHSELVTMAAQAVAHQSAAAGLASPESPIHAEQLTPLFKDFAEQWMNEREIDWKRGTLLKVRRILSIHLAPTFRVRRVSDITKAEILSFRTTLAKDQNGNKRLSASRINGIMNVLSQILEEAADRYNFNSPYKRIKPLRVPKTKVHPLSVKEIQLFLEQVPEFYRPYYTIAFFTGMRPSEQNGLRWKNVDFERGQILVEEALIEGTLEETKTIGSERFIELSQPVVEALHQQMTITKEIESKFIFCTPSGVAINYRNQRTRIWYPSLVKANLDRRKPYETRHTAATLWLSAGESPEWIARQLGHTSTKMLFTVYSRFVPNLTQKDGLATEKLLGVFNAPATSTSTSTSTQKGEYL